MSPTNLLNLLSTGLFRQQIPNVVGKDQRASSHSTSILQGLKPSDREQPPPKRRALFKIIEFPPRNQARLLRDLFDIMPRRQQSAQKRTHPRLVFHQESHKSFVTLVVVRSGSFFSRLIIHSHYSRRQRIWTENFLAGQLFVVEHGSKALILRAKGVAVAQVPFAEMKALAPAVIQLEILEKISRPLTAVFQTEVEQQALDEFAARNGKSGPDAGAADIPPKETGQ